MTIWSWIARQAEKITKNLTTVVEFKNLTNAPEGLFCGLTQAILRKWNIMGGCMSGGSSVKFLKQSSIF